MIAIVKAMGTSRVAWHQEAKGIEGKAFDFGTVLVGGLLPEGGLYRDHGDFLSGSSRWCFEKSSCCSIGATCRYAVIDEQAEAENAPRFSLGSNRRSTTPMLQI